MFPFPSGFKIECPFLNVLHFFRRGGTMVTYGGMSKKPITVSTTSFIFKVSLSFFPPFSEILLLWLLLLRGKVYCTSETANSMFFSPRTAS